MTDPGETGVTLGDLKDQDSVDPRDPANWSPSESPWLPYSRQDIERMKEVDTWEKQNCDFPRGPVETFNRDNVYLNDDPGLKEHCDDVWKRRNTDERERLEKQFDDQGLIVTNKESTSIMKKVCTDTGMPEDVCNNRVDSLMDPFKQLYVDWHKPKPEKVEPYERVKVDLAKDRIGRQKDDAVKRSFDGRYDDDRQLCNPDPFNWAD